MSAKLPKGRAAAATQGAPRRYRKRRRAEQEEETRLRITEATVALHGTVGPARTTVSAVAERAGVQRATVYRHFPDEAALFGACTAHWIAGHPLPDLAEWAAIADPGERLRTALGQLYAWFGRGEAMIAATLRDAPAVAALAPTVAGFGLWFDTAAEALLRGRRERGRRRRLARAAIGHALAFETWRSLARAEGLAEGEAVALMVSLVEGAGSARPRA